MKPKEAKKEKKQKATPEYRDARLYNMLGTYGKDKKDKK